ncbi:ankyrin-2-like [Uloborus diversus]|uniref:ankyrin-2-like n=1 Tax=Uloborus diversus TaxID=327109 RepID=UPI00240A7F5F|nr:ankyrin-2-like [Uloborus diversus]
MVTLDNMTDGNASFLRAARSGNLEKVIEHLKGSIDINTSNANGLNALHLAAKEGHVTVVTELLKRGANVNAATKKGNTALHIASLAGQEEVVRVLIQLGANVNVQSQNGFTPLYMAAQENHDHVVSFLLANGANQSLATEDGFTPLAVALQQGHDRVVAVLLENDTKGRVRLPALHIAAKKDDCKAATLLLQSDHNPDVTSKSGFTPLHIAAHYGNENIAKILLSKGADVNYAAKHQITPLHVASKWGKTNMVALLLEKGANIEASTRDGLTPLHCASRSGHEQVVDLLLEKGAPFLAKTKNGLAPLHMASQGDHVDSARILLYHKAPVDDVTVDYLTALHVAAHCGHVKVAKLLLDRKADPNARALNGFTPLHIACKKNRIKVVELLLKHGASIEATTESGLTPLHVASFMGCMNIVIYLIQNGAHPDVPTVRGETPLHLAARANQTDIIRILLRNGASVDARAREEQTPLHIAARLGNVDIVSLLLQHGAAVDAVTKDMYTALHIAAKEDQEEVASALMDHGASLTSTTKKGFTPLHLAAKYGNIKVARLLLQKGAPVDAQGKNGVTPLHVAAHYDHVNVALLLLDKGASPHAMAKNGYTPLHIAAKKNQMDIASTLLEYGAKTNSESKAGFTPLHLSSQEGHADMSALLIDNKADVNHRANNGLTPLHLCAQDDRVSVASILTKNGAEVCPKTKAGYTPLHVAAHFGQINMVRFLLQNEASVHNTTSHGYTPLHQAAQQGHTLVVNLLLENQASPNVTTMQGQTPLSIAQRLGYISVVETLKVVTETTVITTTTTVTEEKYKVVAPETMQETFMTDSEDEGGADFDEVAFFGKPTHATHVYLPYVEGKHFHMSEEAMLGDQSYRYLTADEMKSLGDDSLPIDVTKDEKHHDVMQSVKQFGAPMVEEDNLSPQHVTPVETGFSEKFSPDNVDLARAPVHAGSFSWDDDFYYSFPPKGMLRSSRLKWKTFLVSFMVDARGGAMRGCRHSGVRVIIPPRKAAMPMRITCRYLRKEKLIHPPPLMEGEACASRILEMGPVSAKFLGPVIIEVPHFASTRGKEREIIILRSDTGESWREHTLEASEEAVQEVLNESFEGEELSALEDLNTNRITRILTTDFPQYFAIVCRVRQESHGVGPEGGMVSSTVVPQVQAIFPEGALTKKIRVGLQAQPIAPELVAKLLGNRVAVSPIVTVEPRRRKFHKPITLTIPVPQAVTKGMINQYSGEAPTLRLLCSITGGSSKAQWEDVTGSTPLTFVNDCVSFTTTVSARFWLMDCRQVNEVTRFATELYQEAVYVPFMSKFVIFAKRNDPYEAQLRVFCMTDDKEDKTLESQEHFTEVAKSRDVEVLEGKTEYLEFAGNLVPVTKSGEQLKFTFQAFHENRLPFTIRVKDPHAEPMGRIAFMREPRAGRGEPPQVPICNLNVALPDITLSDSSPDVLELVTLEKRYDFIQEAGLSKPELIHRADLRLSDIARELEKDWISLAQQLDMSEGDIEQLKSETAGEPPEQALMMLRLWLQKSGPKATGNELEKALRRINREDIIKNCMFNVELVTDDVEKAVAKVHLDQSGFDVFKEELGSSREASMRRGASLDISYDEQDIMKEAESAAETSSETGSLFEREHIPHSLTDDKVEKPEIDENPPSSLLKYCVTSQTTTSSNITTTDQQNQNNDVTDTGIVSDSFGVKLNSSLLSYETSQTATSNDITADQQMESIDVTDTAAVSNSVCTELKSSPKVCETSHTATTNIITAYQHKENIGVADTATVSESPCLELNCSPISCEASHSASSKIIIADEQGKNIDIAGTTTNFKIESKAESQTQLQMHQSSRKLHEFWPPDKISLNEFQTISKDAIGMENKTIPTKNDTDFESCTPPSSGENIMEEISIAPSNGTHTENIGEKTKRKNDLNNSHDFDISYINEVNDLGYCSMDKDPSNNSISKTVLNNNTDVIDISRLDQKFSESENSSMCIIPNEPKVNIVEILNNRNIMLQNMEGIDSKQLYSNLNLGFDPSDEFSKMDKSLIPVEETAKLTMLKSDIEYHDFPKNVSTSGYEVEVERIENKSVEGRRTDTLKDISPSELVFHIKEDTFRKKVDTEINSVDTTSEANIPPVAQELVARLTESETWPSGDLDTSQVSVSSLPDDEKSETNTAVLETTAISTKETVSTFETGDKIIPSAAEKHAESDNFDVRTLSKELDIKSSVVEDFLKSETVFMDVDDHESSLKSDSLDDISRTLGTPSSDNVEPDAGVDLNDMAPQHKLRDLTKSTVKEFLEEHTEIDPQGDSSDVVEVDDLSILHDIGSKNELVTEELCIKKTSDIYLEDKIIDEKTISAAAHCLSEVDSRIKPESSLHKTPDFIKHVEEEIIIESKKSGFSSSSPSIDNFYMQEIFDASPKSAEVRDDTLSYDSRGEEVNEKSIVPSTTSLSFEGTDFPNLVSAENSTHKQQLSSESEVSSSETSNTGNLTEREALSNVVDEIFCEVEKDSGLCKQLNSIGSSKVLISEATVIRDKRKSEKTEVDGSGSTTHIIQRTTHMTIVGKTPDGISVGEGDHQTEAFQVEAETPESPELSFAEKRDFFQKLSLSSSSPSVTPTHTAKSSVETEIRLETIITEDTAISTVSPEEQLSFVDRLKFFEKSSEEETPPPEVKEIKRETWTIATSEKNDEDSIETIRDVEKEREVETIEVERVSEVIFREKQVSLPLYESKEVLETIDSSKDTKVEVVVKTFSPGSEQVEICSVENIPRSDAEDKLESNTLASKEPESLDFETNMRKDIEDVARVSDFSGPSISSAVEQDEKLISDEEFLSKTLRSFTESSYEVSKNKIDAFKKEAGDKGENKWQRESPDNISIVKETMEPSLGKSEIFICTEETLDSVKKILSVAEAESNVVLNESEPSFSDVTQDQEKLIESEDVICTKAETKDVESQRLPESESMKEMKKVETSSRGKEVAETSTKNQREDQISVTQEDKIKTTSLDPSQRTKYILSEDIVTESICKKHYDGSNVGSSEDVVLEKLSSETIEKSVILDQSVTHSEEIVQDSFLDSNVVNLDETIVLKDRGSVSLEELRAKIEKERETGIHFEETLSRSVGSNESCFSSSKDHSVEIEFLPVLEVSDDVSKVSVDKTGHEALGTPCSFHKEMTIEGQHLDLEKSFEERQSDSLEKRTPLTTAVEKAEYEEGEKHTKENLEEIIYRESLGKKTTGKETLESVEVTQFKEHSCEVYNLPSQKLMEKFSSKKLQIETSCEETKTLPTQKLNQFLDSVTQIEEETGAYSLPSDLAPVHKRTEEWLDQSGEIMLKEGSLTDAAENGLFEDRVPTLDEEQHKRSSPTAESFDDKARVEQCDTDVMMQLLDFVSRNDVELSEVRTEDEAPDIEEDVSPSTEEEICTSITYETNAENETKELGYSEEKTRDCLKVVETETLLLSPLRSSFDSVTSPSRKDFSSENIDTVMESRQYFDQTDQRVATCSRQMLPQSSLEVEVGSHASDEFGTHDNEKEMTHLSYVEEEQSKAEFEVVGEGIPGPTMTVKREDQALNSGIVLEEHSKLISENQGQGIPEDKKDTESKTTTVELTTSKIVEETILVKDPQASEAAIIAEISSDISKDIVKESSEDAVQAKDSSTVILTTDSKMMGESTACPSSTPSQIFNVSEEGISMAETSSKEHVLKASISTDEDLEVQMEESHFVTKEIIRDSAVVPQLLPCAFDNTAFAGADFIDKVEQTVPVRARSPYEVVREDQGDAPVLGVGQISNEHVIKEVSVSKISFMPKQIDIRRRPILQQIPSEISEEDLVEREIISPITKEFEVFEEEDVKGKIASTDTEISYAVTRSTEEKSQTINEESQSDLSTKFDHKSPVLSKNINHYDSKEILSSQSDQHISPHAEKDSNVVVYEDRTKKQTETLRTPPANLPVKSDLSESVTKTDEGTTPESDTGIPTSPFELISEISDEEHKTGLPSSITLMKSDNEDRSQDSVITTTQSQSYTESTFSASIRTSSKDLSDSCTLNEAINFQSKTKTTRTSVTTFTKTVRDTSDDYMQENHRQLLNGPGEVEYRPEYDDDHEYCPDERLNEQHGFGTIRVSEESANDAFEFDDYKKSRYSSVSDDVIDSEIGEICSSDQQLEDIIERPVTPEPPKDDEQDLIIEKQVKRRFDFKREEFSPTVADEQLVLSPLESPDELKPGFAYGMQFEKEVLDSAEEAMDIDSDQYSEGKEPAYAYGMRFERDPDLEEEDIPCYGDLYTHEEEDEDALENGEKPKSFQKQVKDADFDILAGRKYFSKNVEFDDLSMSSLQEFERLEAEIVSGRKSSIGSLDSLNGKNHTSKSGDHDDVSMSSLTEFERIERECTETEKIDPAMQESITQLSEIEEGHESQASEASHGKSDDAKEDLSLLDDQDMKLQDIDELVFDTSGIAPEEQPYQYIIQKTHATAKGVSSTVVKTEIAEYVGAQDSAEIKIETFKKSTIRHEPDTRQKSLESYSYDSVKEDEMDQDSLRDEFSLKPDSLIDENKDFQDSLHEDRLDDADSLQGDIPDEMRDSLFEEKHIEDDSLHEMDILPDESSLSLESSLAAALSHDSSKADDRKHYSFDGESDALRLNLRDIVTSSDKADIVVTDYVRGGDVMVSSTDSLEQSSSAAFAAFHMESESAMSSSLNSAITSEDYTMISSTDTLEHEGRITFRYEDIPVDDLETILKDRKNVFVDSEGNIQAQYNVEHILETEGNINSLCSREKKTEVQLPSSTTVHVHSAVTSAKYVDDRTKSSAPIPFTTTTGTKTEDISYESSDFDPDVEVEEVHTTDEFGNPKVIRKVKRFVHTKTQFSSSSSPKDVEEKLKEFLREHAAGESAGIGEEEVKEEKTIDAKGNVVLIRTVQQQMLSEPQVHSKTFTGPDADTLSQDFVETFKTLDPTENVCEYEKIDDEGNVVRVTQQVVIKPEVHSISFSGPNARQQMEDYMKQWTATSQMADEYEAGQTSTFFSADELHRFSDQSRQHGFSENSIHSCVEEPTDSKVFASSIPSQSSEKITVQAEADHAPPNGKEKSHETGDEKPQQ